MQPTSDTEHKGEGPDFAAIVEEIQTLLCKRGATVTISDNEIEAIIRKGLAAAHASAGEAYREALKAAADASLYSDVRELIVAEGLDDEQELRSQIAQAILALPIPEKWGGGK